MGSGSVQTPQTLGFYGFHRPRTREGGKHNVPELPCIFQSGNVSGNVNIMPVYKEVVPEKFSTSAPGALQQLGILEDQ